MGGGMGGGMGNTAASPLVASALIQCRAALSGPFQGATLPLDVPAPLDRPGRLAHWAAGPRAAACEMELLSGIHLAADTHKDALTLSFVDLAKKPLKRQVLVKLVRPGAKIFRQQLELLANYAELRADRGSEVLAQTTGVLDFFASIVDLQAHRHKYTLEVIAFAMTLAMDVGMRIKHACACQRPSELSPQIQTMVPVSEHAS